MEGITVSKPTVRLIHGDCLDVLKTLDAGSVDAVITDPPYLVNYKGRWDGEQKTIVGDDDASWVLPAYGEMHRVLRNDSFLVTFYGWPHCDVFMTAFKVLGFRVVSHLVFVKAKPGLGVFTRGRHEVAFLLAKGKPKPPKPAPNDVFDWPWRPKESSGHPNQKPVQCLSPLVDKFAPDFGTVLDPFMGSGSTGVACVRAGINFIGVECDPIYFATAERRIYEANDTLPLAG
jgi:site-specific DNA-methyltransferase (adenine-specific)